MICSRRFRLLIFLAFVLVAAVSPRASAVDWPPIDPADLAMKDLPKLPGAPAVILRREEIDDDLLHFHNIYERIKILTDAGREYATLEINYGRSSFHIANITGRTIHADGSIIPFDGKTFEKTVYRARGVRVQVKSFTLPDVQVGSIVEYRYSLAYDNGLFHSPEWEIQRNLFQKSAYFQYIPFQFDSQFRYLQIGHGQAATEVAWTPYIPNKEMAPKVVSKLKTTVELNVSDIPPFLQEPNSPPERAMKWRVSFYYTAGFKPEDYWKREGKFWSKDVEGFLGHHESAQEVLAKTVAAGDTPEQKVRKIYDFVAGLENRSYIPHRGAEEAKVLDIRNNKNAEDVLQQRSGYHDDLNRLFVALVREAGLPASMIWVPDRSELFFDPNFLSTRQLDAEVAIVQLNGKEVFLDPGTKYCPYGMLNWRYAGNHGLRQTADGTTLGETPLSIYNDAITQRIAKIQLTSDGKYEGTVIAGFQGLEALSRRQNAGSTDEEGRKKALEDEVRNWLPGGSEIAMTKKPKWDDTESAVVAEFKVSGPLATSAGKRWTVPAHFFELNEKAKFPASQRVNPVYLYYPSREIDEVHITLPAGMEVESMPPDDNVKLDYAMYKTTQKMENPTTAFSRRDLVMGGMAFTPAEYKAVKDFYDKVKTGDDQPMLLKGFANAQGN